MRSRLAQHELDDPRVLVPLRRPLGGEARRRDVVELDGAALGLGHDLRRHDDDVAVDDVAGRGDQRRQVVARADLRQPGDARRSPCRRNANATRIRVSDGHRSVGGRVFSTSHTRMQHGACPSETVSELFDPAAWRAVEGFDFTDITYHRAVDQGTVRIAFDRPEVRNAFRPHTVDELYTALDHARMSTDVGCVLLTGNGPSPRDGGWAFCSGGDQRIRGKDGYKYSASSRGRPTGHRARAGPGGCTSSRCSG